MFVQFILFDELQRLKLVAKQINLNASVNVTPQGEGGRPRGF